MPLLRVAMAPLLFTVPGLGWEIQSYGFFMGLALVVGWVVSLALARADRLPADSLGTVYVASVAGGVLAARAGWLVQHPDRWEGAGSLLSLSADGLAPFVGIVVALLLSTVMATLRKVPVTAWFDVIAPAFAVGTILERVGALLAGSGYGRYAPDWPLSIRFPPGSAAYADHLAHLEGLLAPGAESSLPVHPTQLYGAVLAAVGLWFALWLRKRRQFSGQVFLSYAMYVIVARTFVEDWFRADAVQPVLGPLNPGQVAGVALLIALGIILRTRGRIEGGLRYWEGGRWSPGEPPPSAKGKPEAKAKSEPKPASKPAPRKSGPGKKKKKKKGKK